MCAKQIKTTRDDTNSLGRFRPARRYVRPAELCTRVEDELRALSDRQSTSDCLGEKKRSVRGSPPSSAAHGDYLVLVIPPRRLHSKWIPVASSVFARRTLSSTASLTSSLPAKSSPEQSSLFPFTYSLLSLSVLYLWHGHFLLNLRQTTTAATNSFNTINHSPLSSRRQDVQIHSAQTSVPSFRSSCTTLLYLLPPSYSSARHPIDTRPS